MADAPLLMGIDVGTTAVKVVVYDIGGAERHRYARAYPTARSGGFVEQDPADWIACLDAAFAEIEAAGLAPAIAAIGVTSQVNTHVFCASDGSTAAPRDHLGGYAVRGRGRNGPRCAGSRPKRNVTEWWGAPMGVDASHMAARMAWMAQAKPDIWAADRAAFSLPKDWVIGQLTGAYRLGSCQPDRRRRARMARFIDALFEQDRGRRAARLPELREPASGSRATRHVCPGRIDRFPSRHGADGCLGLDVRGWRAFRTATAMYLSGHQRDPGHHLGHTMHARSKGALVFPPHFGLTLHAAPTQSGGASLAWFCRTFDVTPEVR
jgi:xylulokinase